MSRRLLSIDRRGGLQIGRDASTGRAQRQRAADLDFDAPRPPGGWTLLEVVGVLALTGGWLAILWRALTLLGE